MPRKTTRTAPSRAERTDEQRKRDALLVGKGYTKADVHAELVRTGGSLSIQGVRAALDNRYVHEGVRKAFCALVGVPYDEAWPASEKLYRTGEALERHKRVAEKYRQ
jgi:hypothetical protein